MHAREAPPPLRQFNPAVSEATVRVVEKALAKAPAARHPDAEALLADLVRLLRGEPTAIAVHPRLPDCPANRLIRFDWTWELEASPEKLWPHVSNTDRLNRAVGIPAVRFTTGRAATGEVRRIGQFSKVGVANVWHEHPFEWIEGRRLGVLREYSRGVFRWLATTTELHPRPGGGTTLVHQVLLEPRNWLGRLVAALEVGRKGRRAVERVYRRIDAFVIQQESTRGADPFEQPASLGRAGRRRLEQRLDRLSACGVPPVVTERLGVFLASAPPQEVARIRPLVLARRLDLDPEQAVSACLHGAREGLLVLLWDILCPVCRIPSSIVDTLRALRDHGRCEACDLNFELDFANSVEMIFRVHPEVRTADLGTYCIGGPAHFPHVAAQLRLASGETMELELALTQGTYLLRSPQLTGGQEFRVEPSVGRTRWDAVVGAVEEPPCLRTGRQVLVLTNAHERELLVRVERTAGRADALTAARASALAQFRELFPGEVLAPGQLVSVEAVTLLVTDLSGASNLERADNLLAKLGDAGAFGVLHRYLRIVDRCVRAEGGAVIKTLPEGVVAVFPDSPAALRAALAIPGHLAGGPVAGRLRVGIHRGAALSTAIDDRLDYFGATVSQATTLPGLAQAGQAVLTGAVSADSEVAALLRRGGMELRVLEARLPGTLGGPLHSFSLPSAEKGASSSGCAGSDKWEEGRG
jgi:class 3 adenylate cyclase